jgi:hypothetical protein
MAAIALRLDERAAGFWLLWKTFPDIKIQKEAILPPTASASGYLCALYSILLTLMGEVHI